jgi:DNA-binding MarR family transcriptional regulator
MQSLCAQRFRGYNDLVANATTSCQIHGVFWTTFVVAIMSDYSSKVHLEAWRGFITAHSLVIPQIDAELAAAGKIPLHWYDVLIELYEAPGQRLRLHDLAEKVVLSRSGLTRLIDKLEGAELLRREADPADRRGAYAAITEKGIEAMREAWPVYRAGIARTFAQFLSDKEAAMLADVFERVIRAARQTSEEIS